MFNFPYGKYLQWAENKFLKLEYYNLQSELTYKLVLLKEIQKSKTMIFYH